MTHRPSTACADELPPEGVVVETQSAKYFPRELKRLGAYWFYPLGWEAASDDFTPTHWRLCEPVAAAEGEKT
jgi:hypothetical protein